MKRILLGGDVQSITQEPPVIHLSDNDIVSIISESKEPEPVEDEFKYLGFDFGVIGGSFNGGKTKINKGNIILQNDSGEKSFHLVCLNIEDFNHSEMAINKPFSEFIDSYSCESVNSQDESICSFMFNTYDDDVDYQTIKTVASYRVRSNKLLYDDLMGNLDFAGVIQYGDGGDTINAESIIVHSIKALMSVLIEDGKIEDMYNKSNLNTIRDAINWDTIQISAQSITFSLNPSNK